MKLARSVCACICFLFLITGCTTASYDRDRSQGKIIAISLKQLKQKMKMNETFAVMFTQSMCGFCKDFEELLTTYIQNHAMIMYNVILDKEEATAQENLAIITQYFNDFSSTPAIYYVKKGTNESHLRPNLDDWVVNYRLDEKMANTNS